MKHLSDKYALITGGSTGIGLATAKLLGEAGARVAISARSFGDLEKALPQIPNQPVAIPADISKFEQLDDLFAKVKKEFGKLDILFVNAGIAEFLPFTEVKEDHFDRLMDVNLKGAYFTVQKALPLLSRGASIVLTGSIAGSMVMPESSVYSMSKAGLRSLTKNLASELLADEIRVNMVSPGPIDTPILEKQEGMTPEEYEQFKESLKAMIPMKRIGRSDEVAKVVKFLAGEDASFITGDEIFVDGGMFHL